jgi:thiosulfate/3-mercaptopyruvate sulfurtransferase
MADAGGLLVRAESLFHILSLRDLVVIDARSEPEYRQSHIPGAVSLPPAALETEILLPHGETVTHMLSSPQDAEPVLQAAGINASSRIVIYEGGGGCLAARLFWMLEAYGHTGLQILDGGFDGWRDEIGIVTQEVDAPAPGGFSPCVDERRCADFAAVLTGIGQGSKSLCNSLSGEEFHLGAIPASINVPYHRTYTTGRHPVLRSPEALRELFLSVGGTLDREIVFYCRVGYCAAQCYFAARVAGFQRVRLYDGSLQDWVQRGGKLLPAGRGE